MVKAWLQKDDLDVKRALETDHQHKMAVYLQD